MKKFICVLRHWARASLKFCMPMNMSRLRRPVCFRSRQRELTAFISKVVGFLLARYQACTRTAFPSPPPSPPWDVYISKHLSRLVAGTKLYIINDDWSLACAWCVFIERAIVAYRLPVVVTGRTCVNYGGASAYHALWFRGGCVLVGGREWTCPFPALFSKERTRCSTVLTKFAQKIAQIIRNVDCLLKFATVTRSGVAKRGAGSSPQCHRQDISTCLKRIKWAILVSWFSGK